MITRARLVIVADDLSGAADTAAGFVGAGRTASVVWGGALVESLAAADVVAVDTESRRGSAARARSLTFAAVESARAGGVAALFKKIDSTLRGHVGDEVAAALDAWDADDGLAIVAPAFPEAGRTTIDGLQFVSGKPVAKPAVASTLEGCGLRASVASLDAVRDPCLADLFETRRHAGDRAVVCDARTPDDLVAIARAGSTLGHRVIWVGSAGLGRALARIEGTGDSERAEGTESGWRPGISARRGDASAPVLVVVGSATEIARRQADAVAAAGVCHVTVPLAEIGGLDGARVSDAPRQQVMSALGRGDDVLVTIDDGSVDGRDDVRLVSRLAKLLQPIGGMVGGIVATGGETAVHLFNAWGITGLRLTGEIEPGVPGAYTMGRVEIPAATKAGGFGDEGTLERARRYLHAMRHGAGSREGEAAWPTR